MSATEKEDLMADANAHDRPVTDAPSAPPAGWRPFGDHPGDGSQFLAAFTDLVDEYDEDDRLIARNVPTPGFTVAYDSEVFGLMEYPYNGKIMQGRRWTHWMAIPPVGDA